jgi:hypothetical protein
MLHDFYMWPMQKTCKLQRTFNKNLKLSTHAFLIFWRGAQALTFPYTISALQPLPHINNRQGFGTLLVLFVLVGFTIGEMVLCRPCCPRTQQC